MQARRALCLPPSPPSLARRGRQFRGRGLAGGQAHTATALCPPPLPHPSAMPPWRTRGADAVVGCGLDGDECPPAEAHGAQPLHAPGLQQRGAALHVRPAHLERACKGRAQWRRVGCGVAGVAPRRGWGVSCARRSSRLPRPRATACCGHPVPFPGPAVSGERGASPHLLWPASPGSRCQRRAGSGPWSRVCPAMSRDRPPRSPRQPGGRTLGRAAAAAGQVYAVWF